MCLQYRMWPYVADLPSVDPPNESYPCTISPPSECQQVLGFASSQQNTAKAMRWPTTPVTTQVLCLHLSSLPCWT